VKVYDGEKDLYCPIPDPTLIESSMNKVIEKDLDTFSSQEALDNQRAYYKARLPF